MNSKSLLISITAAFLTFVGGFLLANALNRNEVNAVKAENESLKAEKTASGDPTLTNDEIRQRVAEADANPENFTFQKNLGLALYRYASMKQDVPLLSESARLLERAINLKPADSDVELGLGNAHFDIGYFSKDNTSFARSRDYYQKILAKSPANVDVRTDLGLTYFLQLPPDLQLATAEFKKSIEINPKHEKTLQFLIQALVKQNDRSSAERYFKQLEQANPNNSSLRELEGLLSSTAESAVK